MSNAPLAFTVGGVYCTACLAKSDYRGLRLKHFDTCTWFRDRSREKNDDR